MLPKKENYTKIWTLVLVLAERIKRKSVPGTFYKQAIQNISYFNKKEIFTT